MGRSGKLRSVAIGIGVAAALLVCVAQAFGSGQYTRASAARATPARFAMTVSHGMVIRAWWRLRAYFSLPGVDDASSGLYREVSRSTRRSDMGASVRRSTADRAPPT